MKYIASLSGGRDSTAMTVRLLELGEPVDYICFMDTGYELPEMYDYLNKLDTWLKAHYDIGITRLEPKTSIEEWAFGKITRGEYKGSVRGLPKKVGMDYCTRELKVKVIEDFIAELKDNAVSYVGYVARETRRSHKQKNAISKYPLQEWGWNEPEVTVYLKERRIYNELYDKFFRTGCYLCPKQNLDSWRQIYKNYPALWQKAKDMEAKAAELGAVTTTFRDDYKLTDLEARFKAENAPTLGIDFKWNEENVSCFC